MDSKNQIDQNPLLPGSPYYHRIQDEMSRYEISFIGDNNRIAFPLGLLKLSLDNPDQPIASPLVINHSEQIGGWDERSVCVFRCIDTYTGRLGIIKFQILDAKGYSPLIREAEVTQSLQPHRNIVEVLDSQVYSVQINGRKINLASLTLTHELTTYTDIEFSSIPQIRNFFRRAHRAVKHSHNNRVGHGDIKLPNFLYSDENVPKLCDFGSSIRPNDRHNPNTGTPLYFDPHILENGIHTWQDVIIRDSYAYSCMIIETLYSVSDYSRRWAVAKHLSIDTANDNFRSVNSPFVAHVGLQLTPLWQQISKAETGSEWTLPPDLLNILEDATTGNISARPLCNIDLVYNRMDSYLDYLRQKYPILHLPT